MGYQRVLVDTRTGEIKQLKTERFAKKMTEVWRYVYKKNLFTAAEERVLNRLADFLQLNKNAIVTPGGEYMTIDEMAEHVGLDRSNMRKTIKSLIKKNAIGKWSSGDSESYYINPFLYKCGDIDDLLFRMFDEEAWKKMQAERNLKRFRAGKKTTSIIYPSAVNE